MNINIGKLIKKEIINRDISLGDFAEKIHCTRTNIYNIFNRKSMNTDQLLDICEALGIDLFELLSREIKERMGNQKPMEKFDNHDLTSFLTTGNNYHFELLDELDQRYFPKEYLDISLIINGESFFNETISMSDNMVPMLRQSYARAGKGQLKGPDGDINNWLDELPLYIRVKKKN